MVFSPSATTAVPPSCYGNFDRNQVPHNCSRDSQEPTELTGVSKSSSSSPAVPRYSCLRHGSMQGPRLVPDGLSTCGEPASNVSKGDKTINGTIVPLIKTERGKLTFSGTLHVIVIHPLVSHKLSQANLTTVACKTRN